VGTQANELARRIIGAAAEAEKQYDADTQHGLTQGTGFWRALAVVGSMR
jgi:hypothetical protein